MKYRVTVQKSQTSYTYIEVEATTEKVAQAKATIRAKRLHDREWEFRAFNTDYFADEIVEVEEV